MRSSTYLVFSANYGYQQCVVRMSYNSRLMAVALIVLRVTCGKVLSLSAMSKYAQCTFQYRAPTGSRHYWKQQLFAVSFSVGKVFICVGQICSGMVCPRETQPPCIPMISCGWFDRVKQPSKPGAPAFPRIGCSSISSILPGS